MNGNDEREFYSLSKRKISMRVPLPEIELKRCFGVGFGWILTVASSGDVNMLKPFTLEQIELPKLKYEPELLDNLGFIERAVLSADPSHSSNFVLLACFWAEGGEESLEFWRTGNECWTKLECRTCLPMAAICHYKEKFYVVDKFGMAIWVWDPFGHPDPTKVEIILGLRDHIPHQHPKTIYMVESTDGELLLVTSHNKDRDHQSDATVVRIVRLDVIKRRAEQIAGLGNDAVFLDLNASVSVAASTFPDFVKPNCIYFAKFSCEDPFRGGDFALLDVYRGIGWTDGIGKSIGIYSIQNESTEWFVVDQPLNHLCPPVWINPSF